MQEPGTKPEQVSGTTGVKTTTCYMCACRCGIRVTLRDGEVRYIEGNPDHPLNQGVICAKGASGIMKQYSPARLTKPLLRKPGAVRGEGRFDEISWDEAFRILEERLGKLRAENPSQFALFTGRDQMQALTGLFARQFGTPNYAAHGGFCSVNLAAGLIYTIGGSFWEFGGPDLERSKLFIMVGTAEDHHSNPLKIALSKFKRNGGRFVSINPVRTGYSAIADEWVPIKPGTDGALFLAFIHEIIKLGLFDRDFLVRYTNAAELVNQDPGSAEFGMFLRSDVPEEEGCFDPQNKLWWDRRQDKAVYASPGDEDPDPYLLGEFRLADGTPATTAFQLLKDQRGGIHAGVGRRDNRGPRGDDPAPRLRDGRDRARPEDRITHPVDRRLGPRPRVGGRQPRLLPCHARAGGALQRFPHHPVPGHPDVPAGNHRPARRLPAQGAVSTPRPALRQTAEGPGGRASG